MIFAAGKLNNPLCLCVRFTWSWVHSFGSQGRHFHTRIHGHYWSNYVTHLVPIISCGEGKAFPLPCTSNSTSNTIWINVKFPSSCQLIFTALLQWLPLCRSRVWICKSLAGTTTSKLSRGLLFGGGTWILAGWDCTGSLQRWLEEPIQLGRWRRPRQCEDHTNVDKFLCYHFHTSHSKYAVTFDKGKAVHI